MKKTLKPLIINEVKQIAKPYGDEIIINNEFVLGAVLKAEIQRRGVHSILVVEFDVISEETAEAVKDSILKRIESGEIS